MRLLRKPKKTPETEPVTTSREAMEELKGILEGLSDDVGTLMTMTETLTFTVVASGIENIDPEVFRRLGGIYGVRHAVTSLYVKVMADPDLEPFFRGADMQRIQYKQADMFLAILGIQEYRGPRLDLVHRHLNISPYHFNKLINYVREVLEEAGLTEIETQQFTHALIELKPAITGGYHA